jgi:hypothetical protein
MCSLFQMGGPERVLKKSDTVIEAREKRKAEYIGLNDLLREELRIAFEDLEAVDQRIEDLREFRSHMSRHVSEERYAANELRTLSDNVASVICDYKMKILACYFRESQSKWFGKSGTSAIGFMIITNPTDEEGKASGKKDVSFVILFTDDTYQDEWGVATAKLYLYKNCLPSQIDTVYFTSDGAGYFKSKLHKAIMPFWKMWTGVAERKNRVTPAGDGKTALDGMFGQLMFLLKGAVDEHGLSYYDASSMMDAIEATRGLKATAFRQYLPDRSNQIKTEIRVDPRLDSVLLTVLDDDERHVRLYKHSGYGQGIEVSLQHNVDFYWDSARSSKCVPETKQTKPTDKKNVTPSEPTMAATYNKKASVGGPEKKKDDEKKTEKDDEKKTKKEGEKYWVGDVYNADVSCCLTMFCDNVVKKSFAF